MWLHTYSKIFCYSFVGVHRCICIGEEDGGETWSGSIVIVCFQFTAERQLIFFCFSALLSRNHHNNINSRHLSTDRFTVTWQTLHLTQHGTFSQSFSTIFSFHPEKKSSDNGIVSHSYSYTSCSFSVECDLGILQWRNSTPKMRMIQLLLL